MTRSMLLFLMIALAIGCKPDVNVWIYEAPDSDEPTTPTSDDDDSTEPLADDDDSAVAQEDCGLYLPEDPWTSPACFAPEGVIPQVETLTDGMWVQTDIGETIGMYYITEGRRYHVPTLQRFTSWNGEDACVACAGVANVTPELVATMPLGGNVTARPGTIISIKADSSLYVIDQCATGRPILPSIAALIYGKGWEEHLLSFPYKPAVFFTDYFMGPPVESLADFDLTSAHARTIDEEVLGIGCQSESVEGDVVMEIRAAADLAPQTLVRGEWATEQFAFEIETFGSAVSITWMRPQMHGDSTTIGDGIDVPLQASDRFGYCFVSDGSQTISNYAWAALYWSVDTQLEVPAWTTKRIGVWCPVSPNPTQDGDADEFAIVLPGSLDIDVELPTGELVDPSRIRVGEDGNGVNMDYAIYTQIVNQGELYLNLSAGSPIGTIQAGQDNMVAVYQAAAVYEWFTLQELTVSFTGDAIPYIEWVKLFWVDPFGFVHEQYSTVVPDGWASFSGMTALWAPASNWQDIWVRVQLTADAPTGAQLQAHLNAWDLDFLATGQLSGTALNEADVGLVVDGNVLTVN